MKRRIIFVVALLLIAMVAPCAAINLEVTLQPAVSGSHVNNVLYALEEKGIPIPEVNIREDSNGNTIFMHLSITSMTVQC